MHERSRIMPYFLIILVFLAFFSVFWGCRNSSASKNAPVYKNTISLPGQSAENTVFTRAELRERLISLAESDPPRDKDLSPGAMCYEMAAPPDRYDYTCPLCGEKTLYAANDIPETDRERIVGSYIYTITLELEPCRRLVGLIRGLDIVLDESEFCAFCYPGAEKVKIPRICIIINYPDQKEPRRICDISSDDLILLKEFMDGSKIHRYSNDWEIPLKNEIKRLEELLGIRLNEK
jgi:hypothetical protein